MVLLPHVIHYIQSDGLAFGWSHHVNLGRNFLAAEIENICRLLTAAGNVLWSNVRQCLARTDCRAHRPLADGSAVIAHIALHHLLLGNHHLRDTEGAGQHAVVAGDAARFERGVNNSILAFLDGIRRADLSAGGLVTMPAYVCGRPDALLPLDKVEVDHRLSPMGIAFLARLQAGATADTSRGIDIEFVSEH